MKEKSIFVADNGREFDNADECKEYERLTGEFAQHIIALDSAGNPITDYSYFDQSFSLKILDKDGLELMCYAVEDFTYIEPYFGVSSVFDEVDEIYLYRHPAWRKFDKIKNELGEYLKQKNLLLQFKKDFNDAMLAGDRKTIENIASKVPYEMSVCPEVRPYTDLTITLCTKHLSPSYTILSWKRIDHDIQDTQEIIDSLTEQIDEINAQWESIG